MKRRHHTKPFSIKFITLLTLLSSFWSTSNAQELENHTVTLGADPGCKENTHFKQGTNTDPQGTKLDLNNFYLRRGGKPILPIMGDFPYSRYPRAEWEQSLLQMKAAGIQIIAFYSFWIHHEEEEGKFRFDDNRDVRYFLRLCAKHHLSALVRIGPWVHGETRNGGYPDWYVRKRLKSGMDRSSVGGSLQPEVVSWYTELAKQFKGLYYKDGGPIIGLQVDNEVRSTGPNSSGYQYLAALKTLAVKVGMDVPYYVVTGWPGPIVPEDELMPLWGGYADAPWTQNTKELKPNALYTFVNDRLDKNIGNDVIKYSTESEIKPVYRHPFLTIEMGSGIQPTYLRRPVLNTPDIMGIMYTRLGVGANMLGYYIFHGTQHPLSWHGDYSTQESKSSIYPYPNDYAAISYDFEAPITEWGYLRPYYHDLKLLHQFVTSYAEKLAPMSATIPDDNPTRADDLNKLRYSVRSKGRSGFVFFNNYTRHYTIADHQEVAFTVKMPTETVRIPEEGGLAIKNGIYGVFPFNDDAGGVLIKYATVHPAAVLSNSCYFYYAMDGVRAEFKLDNSNIKSIRFDAGHIVKSGKFTFLTDLKPGKNCVAEITTTSNQQVKLVILTKEEARYSYMFDIKNVPTMLISNDQVFYDEVKDSFTIRSIDNPRFSFYIYPAITTKNNSIHHNGVSGGFHQYQIMLQPEKIVNVPYAQISDEPKFKGYVANTTETPLRPSYDVNYTDTLPDEAYKLTLPRQLPPHVYDLLLSMNYYGNTAALYADKKLLADNYYLGEPMNISLRRFADKLPSSQFIFQIKPLLKNAEIYFEPKTYLDFKTTGDDGLKNITVKPVYEVVFKP